MKNDQLESLPDLVHRRHLLSLTRSECANKCLCRSRRCAIGRHSAASARQGNRILWHNNNGAGGFSTRVIADSVLAPASLFAADVDGDGVMDVLSALREENKIVWYSYDGSRNPEFRQHVISANAIIPHSVFAADMDRDGDIDVLSASSGDDKIAWYENDGLGNFDEHVVSLGVLGAGGVIAVDADRDGDMDVVSASFRLGTFLYENDGTGSFTKRPIDKTNSSAVVTAADLDGDGRVEVIGTGDFVLRWYKFQETLEPVTTATTLSVFAADVDGDGDDDVLGASPNDDKIAWYENDGTAGSFSEHVVSTNANLAQDVYAADLDGDGDTDILSASMIDHKIAWYENNGSAIFAEYVISRNARRARSVFAADVDRDGDTDVLSASFGDDKIAWYENNAGVFDEHIIAGSTSSFFGSDSTQQVYAVDIDGDGDIDVLSASLRNSKIAWYENDGTAGFEQHIISTDAIAATDVFAADLDGDGDHDVLNRILEEFPHLQASFFVNPFHLG